MSFYMRVWQAVDLEGIQKHLLIVGDVTADCAACRHLGIKYAETQSCPGCGTIFRFITARGAVGSTKTMGAAVKRIKDRRPDLTFVDYDDYKSLTGKQSARDFFGP
jgi:hypothetical protein